MPVWLANDAPSTTSRSASFISQLATGVPLRPRTPAASGWSSGTTPLALKVVTIGAPRRSASATIGSMSLRAPWPTMKTGRVARARRSSAAASESAGGPISERPTRPSGKATGASGAGSVCTSSGKTRWATSRRSRACLQASAISSAWWLSGSTVWLHAATGAKAAAKVDLLEGAWAQDLDVDLAGEGEHRRAIDLGVPQPGHEVGRPGPGDRQARSRAAGELAVGRGSEGGGSLVADADVLELAGLDAAADGVGQAEVGVPDHAEDVPDAPGDHGLDHHVGDRARVRPERLDADVDAVVADLDGVRRDLVGELARRAPGQRAVVEAVPRAAQQPVLDRALAERAALVRAAVVERAVLAVVVGERHGPVARDNGAHAALGQLLHAGDAMPGQLGHAPCSPPGARAVT